MGNFRTTISLLLAADKELSIQQISFMVPSSNSRSQRFLVVPAQIDVECITYQGNAQYISSRETGLQISRKFCVGFGSTQIPDFEVT